jgi:uncharacterized protein YxjI
MINIPDNILITQKKDWEELAWGFEIENLYTVSSDDGDLLLYIVETGHDGTRRAWKSFALRPFQFTIFDLQKKVILKIESPFRQFWYTMNILSPTKNEIICSATRKLSFHGKEFSINGQLKGTISGFWLYWRYHIMINNQKICTFKKLYDNFIFIFLLSTSKYKMEFDPLSTNKNRLYCISLMFLPEMLYHDKNK